LIPARSPTAFGPLKSFANAGTCEVSSPIIPARIGVAFCALASLDEIQSNPRITIKVAGINLMVHYSNKRINSGINNIKNIGRIDTHS
jgi:hypothetical protein